MNKNITIINTQMKLAILRLRDNVLKKKAAKFSSVTSLELRDFCFEVCEIITPFTKNTNHRTVIEQIDLLLQDTDVINASKEVLKICGFNIIEHYEGHLSYHLIQLQKESGNDAA